MAHMNVKAQVDQAGVFLSKVAIEMSGFLNETTLSSLKRLNPEAEAYYCDILSTLRKLAVYSEDAAAICRKMGQQQTFPQQAAQQMLHRIYHQCIEEFFTPKKDTWYEDSRSAYTGKSSIVFYHEVSADMKQLFSSLEKDFLAMREELEYTTSHQQVKMV
ncbi:YpuI family protein [Bacillus safensis]|uniref:YpuI family protein n=2 Tax=Bacillus safensis TaxID=561879 RepID=UPI002238949E|nr:YpuI family protein [Bacillus safensis]MCW4645309.1 YpuI family protein [Bacillus safensis]MCY7564216.1 YpuI family protein [Bacillus safensis]MCY7634699.1 YpuI family protein [Bacillus safensis]MCY7648165.1 YpuI family protein [Bacillus safensis]MCY7651738.1 YpuI family protein [Bacillus safensis]